jgi:serine/threonine-protein kinase
MRDGRTATISVDVNQPDVRESMTECQRRNRYMAGVGCFAIVKDGEIVSEVRDGTGGLLEGTLLYGRLWTNGDEVVGRYTRAVVPPGVETIRPRDFPVCITLGDNGGVEKLRGSEPGAVLINARQEARIIHGRWP